MLTKQCARCKCIIPFGYTYCTDCQVIADKQREQSKALRAKRYNRARDPKYKRFYASPEWEMIRTKRLQMAEYKCEYCKIKPAEDVHHEIPIATPEGWANRFNLDGVRAACVSCHNKLDKRF